MTTLQGPAFAPLADERVFSAPSLFHGVITWNNGEIDIAPETVYRDSYAYDSMAIDYNEITPASLSGRRRSASISGFTPSA